MRDISGRSIPTHPSSPLPKPHAKTQGGQTKKGQQGNESKALPLGPQCLQGESVHLTLEMHPEGNPGTTEVGLNISAREYLPLLAPAFSQSCLFLPLLQVLDFPVYLCHGQGHLKEECSQDGWEGFRMRKQRRYTRPLSSHLGPAAKHSHPQASPSWPQSCLWEGHSGTKFLKTKPVSPS